METKRSTNPLAEEILGLYFPILDHGFVSLVDYMGSDADVERAARLSFGAAGSAGRTAVQTRGLIRFLRRHKHTTPSEMVELKFHCSMPIFIARQWIRHRTANVNEVSGRYSLLPMLFYTPEKEQFLAQSKTNKQGRAGEMLSKTVYQTATEQWSEGRERQGAMYEWLTSNDVARELARIDLPLSTYTQWYWKIDLHNLMHFLTLRVDSHAQWEIQQFGKVMAGMMKRVAPLSYEAWVDYDVCGVRLSRTERKILAKMVVAGGGVLSGFSEHMGSGDLKEAGLGEREVTELLAKFPTTIDAPDFELDLTTAKPAAFFEEKMAAATPKTDSPPTS